jgi:hypothetical protein
VSSPAAPAHRRFRLVVGEAQQGPLISSVVVATAVCLLGLTVFTNKKLQVVAPLLAAVVVLAITHERLLRWRSQVALLVAVILFIPMGRYTLPTSLPFNLEPYRLLVAIVALAWMTSLLIDPRVRLRRTPIDAPLLVFATAVILSEVANHARVVLIQSYVIKQLLFLLSFLVVVYLIVSVVRRFEDVDFVARVLTGGGAVVAFFAVIEARTGYDVFNHLGTVFPFLHLDVANLPVIPSRGGRLRVFASAQHPIALGSAMAMLVPFAVYRAHCYRQRIWWIAALLLALAALATGSRTAIVVMVVALLVYVWLRPVQARRFWPALIPALLMIHFAAPGTIGAMKAAFFPKGGLVAQQTDAPVGSGRLATLWPAIHSEFDPNPLVGEGYGTRVTTRSPDGPRRNAPILDDEWLGILCQLGVLGTFALVWTFVRLIRRVAPAARQDDPRGWFLVAVIASLAGSFASMFFYDAFSFTQVTFMIFIVMGLGVSALLATDPAASAPIASGDSGARRW